MMNYTSLLTITTRIITLLGVVLFCCLIACRDEQPDVQPTPIFEIYFDNKYGLLEAQYAAFISDEDGRIQAFRWLNANDTSHLSVKLPNSTQYDCTVLKLSVVQSATTRDTFLELNTYRNLSHATQINLQNTNFTQVTDLRIQFTQVASVDTIIVPDGLTFIRPQPFTNFLGQYRVQHTGSAWVRGKFNGDPQWKYYDVTPIEGQTYTTMIDVSQMTPMPDNQSNIALPFDAPWKYRVNGVLDLEQRKFRAIGDLDRAPGGAVPVISNLVVFQPNNAQFSGYHVQAEAEQPLVGGYTYICNQLFPIMPPTLEQVDFDIAPTTVSDNRLVGVHCIGDFDVLTINRFGKLGNHTARWQCLAQPNTQTPVVDRLPDIPQSLGKQFPILSRYEFGGVVKVRAERYHQLDGYTAVLAKWLAGDDPLWVSKAGLLGIERSL
jgi:hypothetical protein